MEFIFREVDIKFMIFFLLILANATYIIRNNMSVVKGAKQVISDTHVIVV